MGRAQDLRAATYRRSEGIMPPDFAKLGPLIERVVESPGKPLSCGVSGQLEFHIEDATYVSNQQTGF